MAKAVAVAEDRQNNIGERLLGPWERAVGFLKDVRNEMRKVTVPSRKEVQSTTGVVIITVFIFAAYFYIVDLIIGTGLDALLRKLSGGH
jgi:preprotein translocase subunit SecE